MKYFCYGLMIFSFGLWEVYPLYHIQNNSIKNLQKLAIQNFSKSLNKDLGPFSLKMAKMQFH